jgi:hypothetical protein
VGKKLLFTLLGLAVGGGIYGLYVNYGTRSAMAQRTAKELLEKCLLLQVEPNPDTAEIAAWMAAAKEVAPEIFAVNAIAGTALNDRENGLNTALQINSALQNCARKLQK